MSVYFAITDGLGRTTLRLQLVDADGGYVDATKDDVEDPHRVFLAKIEVEFVSPLMVFEGAIGIAATIPRAGLYHCELWANDVPLMSRRISAVRADNKRESNP